MLWQESHLCQRPDRSFHHFPSRLLKQKASHKPFSSVFENSPSCSHLAERGALGPPRGWSQSWPLSESQLLSLVLCLPHGPLSTPSASAHPRSHSRLPVTVTREDKWPHSGTPCQICLSKTKLCAALREKRLAAAQRAGGIGGCKLQGIVNACWLPQRQRAGRPLPLKCQAAGRGALSRPGTDFLLDTSPHPHI